MDTIKELFANKLIVDDREPVLSFSTPRNLLQQIPLVSFFFRTNINTNTNTDTITYNGEDTIHWELLSPNFEIWNQLLLLLMIETIVQIIFAIAIYTFIIKRRGTIVSYIIGWFVIMPLALLFPYELLELLQVENCAIKMAFVTPSTIVFFHCIEAMYNTSPHFVEYSIGTYCIYYSSLLHFEWILEIPPPSPPKTISTSMITTTTTTTTTTTPTDVQVGGNTKGSHGSDVALDNDKNKKQEHKHEHEKVQQQKQEPYRRRITISELFQKFIKVIQLSIYLSIIISIALNTNFKPFPSSNVIYTNYHIQTWEQIMDLFSLSHLLNSYVLAVLIYLTLHFGFTLTAVGDEVKGLVYTKPSFGTNPLLTSTSPSDFWSKKWNLMIHRILKHGIFLPIKNTTQSTYIAILVTYSMSGLLHEYTNTLMFYHYRDTRNIQTGICEDCYLYRYGKLMSFFAWNGIVMILERLLCKQYNNIMLTKRGYNNILQYVPIPIISTFVILTALPVAHWYYGDWVAGQYFHHLSIGLWRLKIAETA